MTQIPHEVPDLTGLGLTVLQDNSDVVGKAKGPPGAGVLGLSDGPNTDGVVGLADTGSGVRGYSNTGFGVLGQAASNSGVVATSASGQGVSAFSDNGVGIYAKGGTWAGVFDGPVVVNKGPGRKDRRRDPADALNGSIVINEGHLHVNNGNMFLKEGGNLFVDKGDVVLGGADCAEDFTVCDADQVEPGTVMVLGDDGALRPSQGAYDTRVAGVVSGAGAYRPALILDRVDVAGSPAGRLPVAMVGKVYCKVDATHDPIAVGDLLTTSPTPGHAMKVSDRGQAIGAVIGKALQACASGRGLIPILASLQ
jgi:hypothetical protein